MSRTIRERESDKDFFFSERKKKINLKKKDFIFVTKETVIFCSLALLNPLIRILKSVRRRNVQMVEEKSKLSMRLTRSNLRNLNYGKKEVLK